MHCPTPLEAAPARDPEPRFTPDLTGLHGGLMRYARSRVHNHGLVEDAVSETMLVALESRVTFSSPAKATAWVYGVLRNKLVDQLRQQGREAPAGDQLPEPGTRSTEWFVGTDWCGVGSLQAEPDQACSRREFAQLLLQCCEQLPSNQRQAFVRREIDDEDPGSICQQLGITEGHLWVLVHRARLRLRVLLGQHGLQPDALAAPAGTALSPT